MRKMLLTAACVALSLLMSGGLPGAARTAAADDDAKPAPAALISPARAFVRLWEKAGLFEKIKFASADAKTLYLGGSPHGLEAVDVETGLAKWYHAGVLPPDFAPIDDHKTLYLVEGGRIVTINPATGDELTRAKPRFSLFTPAYPVENGCLFASGDQYVYAVTLDTGAKRWRSVVDGQPTGSAWNGAMMCFTTTSGMLYGVNSNPLEVSWQYQFQRESCSPPAIAGNILYVGSADYYLYAFNASIGSVEWKLSLSAPVLDTPVIIGSRLYVGTTEHLIHAVDLNKQKDLWTVPGDRLLTTTSDHLIFLRKHKGAYRIGMADLATGKLISEMNAEDYVLFAAPPEGGIFYAVGKTGNVLAIGDRAAIEAREASREAARKAALLAPPAAPATAPTPAPTIAPAPAPTAPH